MRMLCVAITVLACCILVQAKEGYLIVHVKGTNNRPFAKVRMRAGESDPGKSDVYGRMAIKLSPQAKENSQVLLEILAAPKDLVFISPWDGWVQIPPFNNENFVVVVLAERGDRALLENKKAQEAFAEKVISAYKLKFSKEQPIKNQKQALLDEAAKFYGFKPDEIDKAITALGKETESPYQKGLAALYKERYADAEQALSAYLSKRENDLEQAQNDVIQAAFFLGLSLDLQGKYKRLLMHIEGRLVLELMILIF
jgi:hypothetical protein